MQQGTWRDPYLDRVQAVTEKYPTWDENEILVYVFEKAIGQHPIDFILGIKENMRKAEDSAPRQPFENRNA